MLMLSSEGRSSRLNPEIQQCQEVRSHVIVNAESRNPTRPAKKTKATTKAKAKSHQASVEDTSDEDSIDASRNDG